MIDFLSFYN